MYLLIPKCYGPKRGGAYTVSKSLTEKYPKYLDLWEEGHSWDHDQYKRIIFTTQAPQLYRPPVNIVNLKDINHLIFIRDEYNHPLYNSCTNGFWYYKEHKSIKNYIPFIPDMSHVKLNFPDIPCYGFYSRPAKTPDSYWYCMKMLRDFPMNIDVCTMGEPATRISRFPNVRFYSHEYKNEKFFEKITHFVYPASRAFIDPFPTSLCEAVQARKEIIIPEIQGRSHKDGIDDIRDAIWYDRDILDFKNFEKFYHQVFENNFEHSFDRSKYRNFEQWLLDL